MDKLKASWLAGELTSPTMSANEIAVANMAAVETAQFATYLIHMTYEDYLTAMEKE